MARLLPPPRRSPEPPRRCMRTIAPSERYAALFDATLPELPGIGHARRARVARRRASSAFARLASPAPRSRPGSTRRSGRSWRDAYTLATAVGLRRTAIAPYLLKEPGALRLVFVNGHLAADLSDDLPALPGRPVRSLASALEEGHASPFELGLESGSERALQCFERRLHDRWLPAPAERRRRVAGSGPAAVREPRPGPAGADQPAQPGRARRRRASRPGRDASDHRQRTGADQSGQPRSWSAKVPSFTTTACRSASSPAT